MSRRERGGARGFFPMQKAELAALIFLILFSVVSFLPAWRELEIAGMALFGWLMAALMLISPALMLLVFRERRPPASDGRGVSRARQR